MNEKDLYWLAGLLEGEGSFCKPPPSHPTGCRIALTSTDEDIIARAAELMEVNYFPYKKQKEHHKNPFRLYVVGHKAVSLMRKLHPLMGVRRKQQIDEAVKKYYENRQKNILLKEDLEDIRIRLLSGETHSDIAKIYGVDRSTISKRKKSLTKGVEIINNR